MQDVGFLHIATLLGITGGGLYAILRDRQAARSLALRRWQITQARLELGQPDPGAVPRVIDAVTVPQPTLANNDPVAALPGITTLGQVLATGWRPSRQAILMAQGPGGALLTVPLKKLVHVLMLGPTGTGKSNVTRVVFSQIETLDGVQTEWWNPHYMPVDQETGEEWWQMAAATTRGSALTQINTIMAALETLCNVELPARKARGAAGQPIGPPCFYLIDEVPVLSADKQFMEWVGPILREGRKYGLFVMMASQDAQIKTLGGSVGLRANAQTVFYGGGDKITANSLFGFTPPDPPGQGVIYLKSDATPDVPLVRIPLAENADLNTLLGPVIGYKEESESATVPPIIDVATVGTPVATVANSEAAIQAYLSMLSGMDVAEITAARTGIDSSRGGAFQKANKETQQLIRDGARAFLAQNMEG